MVPVEKPSSDNPPPSKDPNKPSKVLVFADLPTKELEWPITTMALSKRVNKWPAVFDMAEPAFQRGFYATEITDPDNPHFLQTVREQAIPAVRKSAKNPEATLATITATEWRKCLIASTSVQTRTKYDYTAEEVQTCINIMVSLALTRHGAFGLDM